MLAWRALLGTYITVREQLAEELERERSLPLTWYELMLRLEHSPGRRLRMQDLARGALLSKSGLTQAITAMESKGLVLREPVPGDRRGAYAQLTAQGRRIFRRAALVHLRGINRHFGRHLSPADGRALAATLARIGRAEAGEQRWQLWDQAGLTL
jgi:DNA-binding MarR family transcriptional regulator